MCIRDSVDAAVEQLLAQGVLQVVAYIALAHGDADGQRAGDVPVSYTHLDVYKRQGTSRAAPAVFSA